MYDKPQVDNVEAVEPEKKQKGLPFYLKRLAFFCGHAVSMMDADAAEKILLFLLSVVKVIIKATPSKTDDAILKVIAPAFEEIAEAIGRLNDD